MQIPALIQIVNVLLGASISSKQEVSSVDQEYHYDKSIFTHTCKINTVEFLNYEIIKCYSHKKLTLISIVVPIVSIALLIGIPVLIIILLIGVPVLVIVLLIGVPVAIILQIGVSVLIIISIALLIGIPVLVIILLIDIPVLVIILLIGILVVVALLICCIPVAIETSFTCHQQCSCHSEEQIFGHFFFFW